MKVVPRSTGYVSFVAHWGGRICCAQQTGMHILVVEVLLILWRLSVEGKDVYSPDARPALLETPCLASLATSQRFTGDALLTTSDSPC